MPEKLTLEIDSDELTTILTGLAELPYKYVNRLYPKIVIQSNRKHAIDSVEEFEQKRASA